MVQLPALDNKWLAASPQKSTGKSLSLEPQKEKASSPANDISETSVNSKSDFSSRSSDFQSTLKNKIDGSQTRKEDKFIDTRERSEDDDQTVTLADSDAVAGSSAQQAPMLAPAMVAPKHQAKAFTAAQAPQAQAMEHRLAWNSFLHTMKEKLGISAQDIMKAFKSLTEEELKAPPEQNITKLVQQLGLNDQQAAMAHQMFQQLIVRTDSQPLNKDSKLVFEASPLATMTQQEIRQQKTESSLQQMNRQFFMRPQAPAVAAPQKPEIKEVTEVTENPKDVPAAFEREGKMVIPPAVMKASQGVEQVATPVENFPKVMQQQAAEPKAPKAFAKPAALEQSDEIPVMPQQQMSAASIVSAPKFMPKNMNSTPSANLDPNANVTPTLAQTPTAPIPVMPMAPTWGATPDKNRDESSDDSSSNVMMEADEAVMPGHNGFAVNNNEAGGAGELKKAMPTMAVPELVQQAHVMVKDGGGEMKVVLTPEGLGEVAMKVNVKDGKVNVEMLTQSDEAKKVLENGFRALSEGLKAHHLNLESIQVTSANSLSTQLEQQYRDAQRHQAQQFLEQFHQDNQGWRQSYFDIPGAQVYRSQQNRASVGPQILSNPSANSRRLDLVA